MATAWRSRSPMTARVSTSRPHRRAAVCRGWPTGWPRSAEPFASRRPPVTAPRSPGGCRPRRDYPRGGGTPPGSLPAGRRVAEAELHLAERDPVAGPYQEAGANLPPVRTGPVGRAEVGEHPVVADAPQFGMAP